MVRVGSDIYGASPYPARDSGAGRVVVPACPLSAAAADWIAAGSGNC